MKKNKLIFISVFLIVIIFISLFFFKSSDDRPKFFIGTYSTLEGGEINVVLNLLDGGKGTIIYRSWTENSYEYEEIDRKEVLWEFKQQRLIVSYYEIRDVFQYKENYFDIHDSGRKGLGLLQTFPIEESSWVQGRFLFKK